MVEYSKFNVKLTDAKLKKLKADVKNKTGITLRMSLKMFYENDLPHELLLTTRQKAKLRNAFNNNMSTDLKLSRVQISKIIQSGGFLGSLLGKLADPLMKVVIPLGKQILAPLRITTAPSAIDAGKQKKINGSGTTALTISNEEMNYIMKIFQALEDSNTLLKRATKTIKKKAKEQKGGFLSMLLGTLGASLLGHLLARKGIVKADSGSEKERGIVIDCWYWKTMRFLMSSHPLTNFEIQRYYQNEPEFNGVFSRNNLHKTMKDGAYVINLDEHEDVGTHWIALFCNKNELVYFDSFGV